MAETFVQVGMTAKRDPRTGGFLPAVPLYIKVEEEEAEAVEQDLIDDLAGLLAMRMKQYIDGCRKAGVPV